ncbi:hypothetical protein COU77_00875 [Candidatus Peregrinibacteria bacterium CG10_big_fil_rev_8_21_14_0_10_49_16]|nr:MAG: hypothetical protein COW95_03685 [Candidatus Peregrinibacteria bacterium CG22_combo_CG10-13_8_21_14_all_49_11]PIR52340.1 MAG: hypothetical protein COU77_00875 [Candidatus Peregrinibacteria bacterium CG10_big_fil_rev_8_21_14_0_10_49_16]
MYMPLLSPRGFKAFLRSTLSRTRQFESVAHLHALRAVFRIRINIAFHSPDAGWLLKKSNMQLFVDGDKAFQRIEQLLYQAQHTVMIQMFVWQDDTTGRRMASVLLDIADRGVKVIIKKDAVGDFFEYHQDFLGTQKSKESFWMRFWKHSNITVEHEKRHNHSKVYIIDGHTLLLTGMNLADEYRYLWHDYMIELQGTRFVESYLEEHASLCPNHAQIIMNTERVKNMRSAFTKLISEAQESIVIEHVYFCDEDIVNLLAKRSAEGISVTVIIPEKPDFQHHANMHAIGQLLSQSHGQAQVFLYPGMFHAKLLLVDKKKLFIGSGNLMKNSLDQMGETNVLLQNGHTRLLWTVRETLRHDILKSKPLTSPPQLRWMGRLLAWLRL